VMIAVNVSDSAVSHAAPERDRRMIVVRPVSDETGHRRGRDQGEDDTAAPGPIAIPDTRTIEWTTGWYDRRCSLSDRGDDEHVDEEQNERARRPHSSARRRPDTESASGFTLPILHQRHRTRRAGQQRGDAVARTSLHRSAERTASAARVTAARVRRVRNEALASPTRTAGNEADDGPRRHRGTASRPGKVLRLPASSGERREGRSSAGSYSSS